MSQTLLIPCIFLKYILLPYMIENLLEVQNNYPSFYSPSPLISPMTLTVGTAGEEPALAPVKLSNQVDLTRARWNSRFWSWIFLKPEQLFFFLFVNSRCYIVKPHSSN